MQTDREKYLQELMKELIEISPSYQQSVTLNTLAESAVQLKAKLLEIITEIKQYRLEQMN